MAQNPSESDMIPDVGLRHPVAPVSSSKGSGNRTYIETDRGYRLADTTAGRAAHRSSRIFIVLFWLVTVGASAYGGYAYGNGSLVKVMNRAIGKEEPGPAPQIKIHDQKMGVGQIVKMGSVVSVQYIGYVGKVSTSTVIDTSAAHGNKPLTFTVGSKQMIVGLQRGVLGMRVGGERLIFIPPELGFGAVDLRENQKDLKSRVVVPANSSLIFDVKLVRLGSASTTASTQTPTKMVTKPAKGK